MVFRDEGLPQTVESTRIRKGRFIWMEDDQVRGRYIDQLKHRIADGYYFSDEVIGKVVDEIAPVMDEVAGYESAYL